MWIVQRPVLPMETTLDTSENAHTEKQPFQRKPTIEIKKLRLEIKMLRTPGHEYGTIFTQSLNIYMGLKSSFFQKKCKDKI